MQFRLGAGVFALVSIGLASDVRVVEEIVAKVNGDIITKSELDRARQELEAQLRQKGVSGPELDKTVKQQAADGLRDQIDTLLLVQHGKDLNIKVDAEVTKRLAQIQIESKIADPDKFHDYIREQTGVPFEDFRQKINDQILFEYTQPLGAQPGKDFTRVLDEGTFALQAHDPNSVVRYKNIRVKRLD